MHDLQYINQGLFTCFVPTSKAGEQAWNELAAVTDGTGKVLTVQAQEYIYQLRKAGYNVVKAKRIDPGTIDADVSRLVRDYDLALLKELEIE